MFKPFGDIVLKGDINEHVKKSIDEIVPKENMNPNYETNKPGDPSQQTLLGGDIKSQTLKKFIGLNEKMVEEV